MPSTEPRLLHKLEGAPWEIEPYLRVGGYDAWRKCVMELSREGIVAEIRRSGLRGRGGAGFPTGTKWDKGLHHPIKERDFDCNARSEEHTSEIQSRLQLVCRLLLGQKKNKT